MRFSEEFREKAAMNLALDGAGQLVYLAPSRVNLQLTQERWPDLEFAATREHAQTLAEVLLEDVDDGGAGERAPVGVHNPAEDDAVALAVRLGDDDGIACEK